MEMLSGYSELSVILQVSAVEGCRLSGVPLYFIAQVCAAFIREGYLLINISSCQRGNPYREIVN